MKDKLESRLPGGISTTQICRWHHLNGRKPRGTKKPLDVINTFEIIGYNDLPNTGGDSESTMGRQRICCVSDIISPRPSLPSNDSLLSVSQTDSLCKGEERQEAE